MKKIKNYSYKYKFLRYFLRKKDFENVSMEDVLNIIIKNKTDVEVFLEDKLLLKYVDNGETSNYLKGLGKISFLSSLIYKMDSNNSIDIDDNFDFCIGVSKIEVLNNQYLVIGGYDNWTVFEELKDSSVEDIVLMLLNYSKDYGFSNFKTMYIRINEEVSKCLHESDFTKPYIYVIKK